MVGEPLYNQFDFAQFYDWANPWPEAFEYFASLAKPHHRILDLGCGTGMFSVELAMRGHEVTGVDPASAMLEIARSRTNGEKVCWITADGRDFDLGKTFDMVLMTGNAFQTVLTRDDRSKVINNIAKHLVPNGSFFFDSLNPNYREWEQWTKELTYEERLHPEHGIVISWNDVREDPQTGLVIYDTFYQLQNGKVLSAPSPIAFPSQDEIAELISKAGMSVVRWIGDYQGGEFLSSSPAIIPLGLKSW
jgi:ubiquinone/menaquinone biosynthesis C-methylase UbiE